MDRFFLYPMPAAGRELVLDRLESNHAIRVMRLRVGDQVELFDGAGQRVVARILSADPVNTRLEELSREMVAPGPEGGITLCVGLIRKPDRLEFLLEKATEIGVGKILLFRADNSEAHRAREDRCRAHILAAVKQSKRTWMPEFRVLPDLKAALLASEGISRVAAHESADHEAVYQPVIGPSALFVGPEGGFSGRELELFRASGTALVSLGRARLRTETAALVMLSRAVVSRP